MSAIRPPAAHAPPRATRATRAPSRDLASVVPSKAERTHARARALVAASRPRQWIKNLLVVAAPATAGLLGHASALERTAGALLGFLLASVGVYLFNDALDAPADRLNPLKAARPVAAGALSARLALGGGVTFVVLALGVATWVGGLELGAVVLTYVLINVAYSLGLKKVPVLELACVASGFVLRAVAGGVAVHIPISTWFAIVTSASALLVVAGKRSAELELAERTGDVHRAVLTKYNLTYLRSVRTIASSVAIVSFCLWAFGRASVVDSLAGDQSRVFFELAVVPFVLGVLCVQHAMDRGAGAVPEELVLHDHLIQGLGLLCLALVTFGIYT